MKVVFIYRTYPKNFASGPRPDIHEKIYSSEGTHSSTCHRPNAR